jgi:hypothetical protein
MDAVFDRVELMRLFADIRTLLTAIPRCHGPFTVVNKSVPPIAFVHGLETCERRSTWRSNYTGDHMLCDACKTPEIEKYFTNGLREITQADAVRHLEATLDAFTDRVLETP